jgi:predicted alpha/beta hydrolase family esterase
MILFLHGANVDADYLTPSSYPLLRRLASLAPVDAPLIQGDWLDAFDGLLASLGPGDAVVGHSHGGAMALKWIAERAPGKALSSFVGCAMPLWGQPDWDMPEFCLPADATGAFDALGRVTILHAQDDQVVHPSHADLYGARIAGARVRHVTRGGHDLDDAETTGALAEALAIS